MAAKAGRLALVKVSGTGVSFTAEAVSTVTTNKVYQITNTAKRVWDRSATITVLDGGVAVDAVADPYTINRLTGVVTFTATTVRVITLTGTYLPMTTIAEGTDVSFDASADNATDTAFTDADHTRIQLGKDCSGSIGRWLSTDTVFADFFAGLVPFVVEIALDGSTVDIRCWGIASKDSVGASRKALITEGLQFEGAADADGRSFTFLR